MVPVWPTMSDTPGSERCTVRFFFPSPKTATPVFMRMHQATNGWRSSSSTQAWTIGASRGWRELGGRKAAALNRRELGFGKTEDAHRSSRPAKNAFSSSAAMGVTSAGDTGITIDAPAGAATGAGTAAGAGTVGAIGAGCAETAGRGAAEGSRRVVVLRFSRTSVDVCRGDAGVVMRPPGPFRTATISSSRVGLSLCASTHWWISPRMKAFSEP